MRTPQFASWIAALCVWVLPLTAAAQATTTGFSLNRFRPAPTTEDGLALSLPRTLGHLRPGASLTLDYAHQPLVVEGPGGGINGAIVKNRLTGHVNGALGLGDRYEVYVHVPVTFFQGGEDTNVGASFPEPRTASFGDISVGGSVRLVGGDLSPFQLGLMATLTLPSGNEDALSGDGGVGAGAALLAAYHVGRFSIAANAGGSYRPESDYDGSIALGSELTFGLGGYLSFTEHLLGMSELSGSTTFADSQAFQSAGTPIEWLNGVRWTTPAKLVLTGAVGVGLTQAPGVPDVRVLFGLGWPPVRPTLEPPDRDKDGILDPDDRCIDDPEDIDGFEDDDGCPDPDNDRDGVPDVSDACPNQAEDIDGFEDADGCPDPDNDQDGIPDVDDRCPLHAEDKDGFEDDDGCPDPDNDQDGIPDEADLCPNEAEDFDGFEDADGCPDPDNDKDGIPDVDDNCPRTPGPKETQGCPSAVRIDRDQIRILQRIEFETGRAELRPTAPPILREVALVINANPQIKLIRVEGHTDDRGSDSYNKNLSQRRAESVMTFLIGEGISPERMVAEGFGEERPLVDNDTPDNRQTNRRVEFHILDPDPGEAERETQDALDAAGAGTGPEAAPKKAAPVPPEEDFLEGF